MLIIKCTTLDFVKLKTFKVVGSLSDNIAVKSTSRNCDFINIKFILFIEIEDVQLLKINIKKIYELLTGSRLILRQASKFPYRINLYIIVFF